VEELHKTHECDFSYGGYLEDRKTLWKGHYHAEGHTTHLGVDFNVPAYTEVCMPFNGQVVAIEKDPHQNGGWGTRVIFKVNDLWVIFAHLRDCSLRINKNVSMGESIGFIGTPDNNGGWFPHLHVQCMKNYDIGVDGYFQAVDNLKELFPNPYDIS
jgi:murein DD-endopeptidase MepM/ murein hydrolase activator NlpD